MTAPSPVWRRNFSRRAGDSPSVVAELPHRLGVAIGSRWTPEHAVMRDPDSGIYFERNPRMESSAEAVQSALLSKPRGNGWGWWLLACMLFPATYVFCRLVWP